MGKRIQKVAAEVLKPGDFEMLPEIQSWHPTRMKTSLRNRLIGKRVTLVKSRKS